MPFTCPRCGAVSHHPDDARHGYCGRCHDFVGHTITPWPGFDDDMAAMRTALRDRNQQALERVAVTALLAGARLSHWEAEIKKAVTEMPEDVQAWWLSPCDNPYCNVHNN